MNRFPLLLQDCSKCGGSFPIEERECAHCQVDKLLKEVMDIGLQVPRSTSQRKRDRKTKRDQHWTLKAELTKAQ
jgi:DnaJ-class molecular chaperone